MSSSRAVRRGFQVYDVEVILGNLRFVLVLLMLLGGFLGTYYSWAARSNTAAFRLFRNSESCLLPETSLDSIVPGICRLEWPMTAIARYPARSNEPYAIATRSPDRTLETTAITPQGHELFLRVGKPAGGRLVVQRFVAPGFYLTGKITAFADSVGSAVSKYHPNSGMHTESLRAIV